MKISHQRKRVRNAIEQSAKHYGSRATVDEQANCHKQANDSVHYPTTSHGSEGPHPSLIARNKPTVCSHLNTWLHGTRFKVKSSCVVGSSNRFDLSV